LMAVGLNHSRSRTCSKGYRRGRCRRSPCRRPARRQCLGDRPRRPLTRDRSIQSANRVGPWSVSSFVLFLHMMFYSRKRVQINLCRRSGGVADTAAAKWLFAIPGRRSARARDASDNFGGRHTVRRGSLRAECARYTRQLAVPVRRTAREQNFGLSHDELRSCAKLTDRKVVFRFAKKTYFRGAKGDN
jgi:hypothetical protein